jgi:hypothetical protein
VGTELNFNLIAKFFILFYFATSVKSSVNTSNLQLQWVPFVHFISGIESNLLHSWCLSTGIKH